MKSDSQCFTEDKHCQMFLFQFIYLLSYLVPEMAFSTPPTLSLSLPLPRGGGQGDRAPVPQAVVKPQVLTHLIEGFVIQEGAEPFPVSPMLGLDRQSSDPKA